MVGTSTSALRNCSARRDVEWNCRITRGRDRKDDLRERISTDMVIERWSLLAPVDYLSFSLLVT
jgi:hypothetical protein